MALVDRYTYGLERYNDLYLCMCGAWHTGLYTTGENYSTKGILSKILYTLETSTVPIYLCEQEFTNGLYTAVSDVDGNVSLFS